MIMLFVQTTSLHVTGVKETFSPTYATRTKPDDHSDYSL